MIGYEEAEIKVIEFSSTDVIVTSCSAPTPNGDGDEEGGEF